MRFAGAMRFGSRRLDAGSRFSPCALSRPSSLSPSRVRRRVSDGDGAAATRRRRGRGKGRTRAAPGDGEDEDSNGADDEAAAADETRVGSREYYQGFFTRDIRADGDAEGARRGDGMEQALKLAAQASGILALGVLAFLKSNGII